jgi:hypothetical protein
VLKLESNFGALPVSYSPGPGVYFLWEFLNLSTRGGEKITLGLALNFDRLDFDAVS